MTGSVVEAQALPASELVEEDVPATPGAPRALEPRQCVVGPHHQHRVPVDQKIGGAPGELASPRLAGKLLTPEKRTPSGSGEKPPSKMKQVYVLAASHRAGPRPGDR